MPIVAATLLDAVGYTNPQVGVGNSVNLLLQYITLFNAQWAPGFDTSNVNDRTVRNWIVSSKIVEANTPTQGNAQQRQSVVDVVVRILFAANAAFSANRITAAQRDAVLAAWNGSIGAAP